MEKFLKKTYPGKFITLKPDEVKILSKIKKDDKLEVLKKIPDMDKVLKPLEIYETKLTNNDSIKYLNLIAKVNRYQIKAFEDQVKEIKDALEKYNKAKLKGKKPPRRRSGKGNITVANAIKEAEKEIDLVKKLTSSLEKAMRSKDPVKGTLEALTSWAQEVCVEKLGKPALKSLEYIFNNPMSIPSTLLGWTRGKWLISPDMYRIIDGSIKCIGSVLLSSGAVILAKRLKDWWNSSMVFGGNPPRRDSPPSGPDFGGGGGDDRPDDNDDKPKKGPSDLDRLRQLEILKQIEKSKQGMSDTISGEDKRTSGEDKRTSGEDKRSRTENGGNSLSGGPSQSGTGGFSSSGPPSGQSGKTIITEGGGNPSSNINPSTLGFGILGTGLLGAGLITAQRFRGRAGLALNDPPQINQDDLDRDAEFAKELQDLEDGAVKHDQNADEQAMLDMFNRDQDARQSAMGAFFGGSGKTAIDIGLQAGLLAAATASTMFKTVRQNIKGSETIDEVVQGKQDLQDLKKEELEAFQNMVDSKPSADETTSVPSAPSEPLHGETTSVPPEPLHGETTSGEMIDDEEDQTLSLLEQEIGDVMSLDYLWNENPTLFTELTSESKNMINDLLSGFTKDDDSEFVQRLKALQLRIDQTERSLRETPNVERLERQTVMDSRLDAQRKKLEERRKRIKIKFSQDVLNLRQRRTLPTSEPSLDSTSIPPRQERELFANNPRQQAEAVVRRRGRPRKMFTQIFRGGDVNKNDIIPMVREYLQSSGVFGEDIIDEIVNVVNDRIIYKPESLTKDKGKLSSIGKEKIVDILTNYYIRQIIKRGEGADFRYFKQ